MNTNDEIVQTIEAFQREIEPSIVAARNEIITADNFLEYRGNDTINAVTQDEHTLCTMLSRLYFGSTWDTDSIRSTVDSHLLPLGFTVREDRWTRDGYDFVDFLWMNADYRAAVFTTTILGIRTAFHYTVTEVPCDSSLGDPTRLMELPGRVPDWFNPNTTPTSK